MDFRHALGQRIAYLLKQNHMTQTDLMKALGYKSTGMVSQIIAGDRGMSAEMIQKASDVLGVNPAVLIAATPMPEDEMAMHMDLTLIISKGADEDKRTVTSMLSLMVKKIREEQK